MTAKKHYHFIGIGGAGMGPLASLILSHGHKVSGSDLKGNSMTERLKKEGAEILLGHDRRHVASPDFVVYSSAISVDNPEMMEARKKNITLLKRAQVLAELANAETAITVAGAHGKTTTSGMISYLLLKAGLQPTTFVGGIVNGTDDYNANRGTGKYFVAEVDESDGSFLYFHPTYSVITNIDFEHLDYYHNWENILKAYTQFIFQVRPDGLLIAFGEDERLMKLLKQSPVARCTYGFAKTNDAFAENIRLDGFSSSFDCVFQKKRFGRIDLKIPGEHNILNSLAAIVLGLNLKLDFELIRRALSEYRGVQRRFQLKADVEGVMVIDDYGHHPTEMAATLRTAQKFGRRVVTVFQPHRYSRTQWLMDELAESLALSDYLILTDIYAASEEPIEGVSSQALFEKIKRISSKPAVYLPKEKILPHLLEIVQRGDLVLTLGAGDLYRVGEEFISVFTRKKELV